ncbi:hypothetical protein C8R47DRAFT_1167469 [Mycena vitilis]|nr:hypothetical protein C8R47DRAFT_1167469 [Mycena vitilis]
MWCQVFPSQQLPDLTCYYGQWPPLCTSLQRPLFPLVVHAERAVFDVVSITQHLPALTPRSVILQRYDAYAAPVFVHRRLCFALVWDILYPSAYAHKSIYSRRNGWLDKLATINGQREMRILLPVGGSSYESAPWATFLVQRKDGAPLSVRDVLDAIHKHLTRPLQIPGEPSDHSSGCLRLDVLPGRTYSGLKYLGGNAFGLNVS